MCNKKRVSLLVAYLGS